MTYTAEIEVADHLLVVTIRDATEQVVDHIHDQVDPHAPMDLHEIVLILRAIGWRAEPPLYRIEVGLNDRLALDVSRLPDPVLG